MKFSQDSSSQTSLCISLMSQDHREPMLLGMGLLRLVTLGELPSCSGRSDQAMIVLWFSVITGGCSVWGACWAPDLMRKRRSERQEQLIKVGVRLMSLISLMSLVWNLPRQASGMGLGQSLRNIHWCFMHEGQGKLAIDSRRQEYFDPLKLSQSVYVLLFQLQLPLLSSTIPSHTTIFHPHSHHHQWLRVGTHGEKIASILAAIVRRRLPSGNHKIWENIPFCSKV